jgi:exonuclease SbcC
MIKLLLLMKVLGQDPESVAVVFETLQSLYKENRLLELFRMLPAARTNSRSINVFKDEERGMW